MLVVKKLHSWQDRGAHVCNLQRSCVLEQLQAVQTGVEGVFVGLCILNVWAFIE